MILNQNNTSIIRQELIKRREKNKQEIDELKKRIIRIERKIGIVG